MGLLTLPFMLPLSLLGLLGFETQAAGIITWLSEIVAAVARFFKWGF